MRTGLFESDSNRPAVSIADSYIGTDHTTTIQFPDRRYLMSDRTADLIVRFFGPALLIVAGEALMFGLGMAFGSTR